MKIKKNEINKNYIKKHEIKKHENKKHEIKKHEIKNNKLDKKEHLTDKLFGIFQSFIFNLNNQIRNKSTILNCDKSHCSLIHL